MPTHHQRQAHQPQDNRLIVPPSRAEVTAHRTTPQHADLSADRVRLTDLPDRLTITQAAALLKIPPILAYRAAETGDLPMVNNGGHPMVDTAQLLVDIGVPNRLPRKQPDDDRTPGEARMTAASRGDGSREVCPAPRPALPAGPPPECGPNAGEEQGR